MTIHSKALSGVLDAIDDALGNGKYYKYRGRHRKVYLTEGRHVHDVLANFPKHTDSRNGGWTMDPHLSFGVEMFDPKARVLVLLKQLDDMMKDANGTIKELLKRNPRAAMSVWSHTRDETFTEVYRICRKYRLDTTEVDKAVKTTENFLNMTSSHVAAAAAATTSTPVKKVANELAHEAVAV